MIKNIIFDVYGTLISTGNGSIEATRKILNLKKVNLSAENIYAKWKKIHRAHIDMLEEFVTEKEIFIRDLKKIYDEQGIEGEAEEDIYPMINSLYGRIVFDDTIESIAKLKANFKMAIGSTTDTEPLLENMKINNLMIDDVYTSEMLKTYKPKAEFYSSIIDKQKWSIEETIYVGDSYGDDIYGPKMIGMKAILLDRKKRYIIEELSIKPDGIINSLYELEDEINRLNMKK